MSENKGSQWGVWDLHIHTPETKLSDGYKNTEGDKWEKFCDVIEASEVSAFGITDYFSIENYIKFKEKFEAKYPHSSKVFFPNIEFRLEVSVNQNAEEVNLHIIFDNKGGVIESIKKLLSRIDTNINNHGAKKPCVDLKSKHDYEQASIDYKTIREKLVEVFGNNKCYLIFAAANNTGLRPDSKSPRKLTISDEIDKICDGFFGGVQNRDYYMDTSRYEGEEDAHQKPVIRGCDAHSFEQLEAKLGEGDVTWIKSGLTFEGLKQIIYEPEGRVQISETKPIASPNKLNKFKFNIPNEAKVRDRKFCFSGNQKTYYLSPYFNCFIGGRGTGKSTILNMLGLKSDNIESSKHFWFDPDKGLGPSDFKPDEDFEIDSKIAFEFLAQSEIYNFAENKTDFTKAIYERVNNMSKQELTQYIDTANDLNSESEKIIDAIFKLKELQKQKLEKEKAKKALEESLKILSSKEYTKTKDEITRKSKEKRDIEAWKDKTLQMKSVLEDIIHNYNLPLDDNNEDWSIPDLDTPIENNSNTQDDIQRNKKNELPQVKSKNQEAYEAACTKIRETIATLSITFSDDDVKIETLTKELAILEKLLADLVTKAGYKEENLNQIASAPRKLEALSSEIDNLKKEQEPYRNLAKNRIEIFDKLKENKKYFEEQISNKLLPLTEILDAQFKNNNGVDIGKITLDYDFDCKRAWENVANEFCEIFNSSDKSGETYSIRKDKVKDFFVENHTTFSNNYSTVKSFIDEYQREGRQYLSFIFSIFDSEDEKYNKINFIIFQTLREKHLNDIDKYKLIKVKYADKDIDQASFGQRCTAVLVVLLLFGNYPLIIDEPEAHLDSSLIANYLVPLIKKTKNKRQIIFATHNANFVINGDAEKVFILENNGGMTNIVETTIEDIKNRKKLLTLEGSKEAFKKRGERLDIIRGNE